MRPFVPVALALLLVGCKPKTGDPATSMSPTATAGGVAPMTSGAAGGMTPVSGGESVEGAGSGVNSSALDAARRAAAKSSAPAGTGAEDGG